MDESASHTTIGTPLRQQTATESTSVLVVGGGLVGLSSAMFLAWQGVPTVLVEKHPGSSEHPRAAGFRPRTIELLRAVGLGSSVPQIPAVSAGKGFSRVEVESLAGKWYEETLWTPQSNPEPKQTVLPIEYSPCNGSALPQDRLEPILREKAKELGANIRFNTEMVNFEQDDEGVTVLLHDGEVRNNYVIRAAYMIAADGHRSKIRETLGISRDGIGHLKTMRSVLFRAQLDEYLQKGPRQFTVKQPDFEGMLATYGDNRWVLFFSDDKERDESTMKSLIYKAIGRTDLNVDIITAGCWELSALIAETFKCGRVFLAGDAAHTLPPNRGGYGANTGIEDAHNLAWKLSAVLSGSSNPQLLDTYDSERRPIALFRHDQIFARPDYIKYVKDTNNTVPIIEDVAMEFGQLYRSLAVIGAGNELPPALRPDQWAGQPGTRAPHVWVSVNDTRLSTLDLFQRGWVLVADDDHWQSSVTTTEEQLGLKIKSLRIGTDIQVPDLAALRAAFGLNVGGASLVRPDGYVAWRSIDLPENPSRTLYEALGRVSSSSHVGQCNLDEWKIL